MAVRFFSLKNISRKFSSALYVTGDKAHNNFVALAPHIDFEEQIANKKTDLMKSIEARRLSIDLNKIEQRWNFFKMMDEHRNILEMTKSEIGRMLANLKKEPDKNSSDIEKLQLHLKLVKDDLKNVKDYSYGVEENAALGVLKLPNLLHSKTPVDCEVVYHQFLDKPPAINKCHTELGTSQELIEWADTDGMFYFLNSDASVLEFALLNYFQKILSSMNYVQVSNADFARSVVVEGCGTDYLDSKKVFSLEGPNDDLNRLHLVGGASLYSFMAYFAKHLVQESFLPLQLFTMGRKYTPNSNKLDLFNVNQNSVVRTFIAYDNTKNTDEIVDAATQQLITLYESLNYHFRLVYPPAFDLQVEESLRVSIQMFSNYLQQYIEVGNLSVYDDYVSKRLLFSSSSGNKERKFLKIISGEVLNVQKVLGCALENNFSNGTLLLSNLLQKYVN